jgi:hypothetical protein
MCSVNFFTVKEGGGGGDICLMPTCLFHVEFPLSPGTLPLYIVDTSAKTLRCKYSVPNKESTGHVRMYLGGGGGGH